MSTQELATDWKIQPQESSIPETEYTPFPIETFPLAVQEFCEDVGRVTQAPIEFSASLCLGVLSACLGKGVVIPNAFKGMRGLPTLQIALALESGTGKTAVSTPVLAPLVRWCKEQREINKAEQSSIIGQIKLLEREIHDHTHELGKGGDYGAIQRQVIEKQMKIDQLKRKATPPVMTPLLYAPGWIRTTDPRIRKIEV